GLVGAEKGKAVAGGEPHHGEGYEPASITKHHAAANLHAKLLQVGHHDDAVGAGIARVEVAAGFHLPVVAPAAQVTTLEALHLVSDGADRIGIEFLASGYCLERCLRVPAIDRDQCRTIG